MGRRGNMRARPGLLFIIVFAVCLVIVYLSWRSMMSPGIKVKDTYSAQIQNFDDSGKLRSIGGNLENAEGENHDRDPDYDINSEHQKKKVVPPALRQYEVPDDKEGNIDKVLKPQPTEAKTPEKQALETDTEKFYQQPNGFITETVKAMERFVHLDLKGAAPKLSYLRDFIPLVKKLGATGLLIEYEDMFPYTGMLSYICAKNAYSMNDIKELLELARVNNLKVMPLIQTFGHMEFVLKSDFSNLRESGYTPQVIDITQNASYALISEMVKQILNAHPEATHIHVGCDEVYELGKGASGIEMQSKKLSESQIFLRHVQHVASIVRRHSGRGVTPVMWDDELRKIPLSDIQNSRLPSLVEIMVWHYTKRVLEAVDRDVWDKYAKAFKSVWIASAFKGATGSRQFFTEPQHHIQNHFSWLDVIAANKHQLTFRGVALTGWQRYDHFATLCELLPVAIPSLAVCLATMVNAGFTKEIHVATSKRLLCSNPIEMTFPGIDKDTNRAIVTQDCRFPGHELYHAVQELYGYKEGMPSIKQRLEGWLSDYQVAHGFSNPGQLRVLSKSLTKQNSGYNMVSIPLKRHLADIYFDDTVDEWMDENIKEQQRRIDEQQEKIKSLQLTKFWPRRPLPQPFDSKNNNKFVGPNIKKTNFQESHFEKSTNISQSVQNKFQNASAGSQVKQYNHNMPYVKSVPELPNQQNQQYGNPLKTRSQQETVNSNIPRGNSYVKEMQGRDFLKANEELPHLPELNNWKDSKREQTYRKRYDLLDLRIKNKTDGMKNIRVDRNKDDLNQQIIKIDGNKRENVNIKPEQYRPPDALAAEIPELPHVNNGHVNPQVDEDDKMRREKYLRDDQNDRDDQNEQDQPSLKKPFESKVPEIGKSDGVFSSGKGFKSKLDISKAEKNTNIEQSLYDQKKREYDDE